MKETYELILNSKRPIINEEMYDKATNNKRPPRRGDLSLKIKKIEVEGELPKKEDKKKEFLKLII
ncbi:MAG: hypothetical protein WC812_01105 [Candidatus Pacearchaeota archaeon]|jgi:hypothetical protein